MPCARILSPLDPGRKLSGIMVMPVGLTLGGFWFSKPRKDELGRDL